MTFNSSDLELTFNEQGSQVWPNTTPSLGLLLNWALEYFLTSHIYRGAISIYPFVPDATYRCLKRRRPQPSNSSQETSEPSGLRSLPGALPGRRNPLAHTGVPSTVLCSASSRTVSVKTVLGWINFIPALKKKIRKWSQVPRVAKGWEQAFPPSFKIMTFHEEELVLARPLSLCTVMS